MRTCSLPVAVFLACLACNRSSSTDATPPVAATAQAALPPSRPRPEPVAVTRSESARSPSDLDVDRGVLYFSEEDESRDAAADFVRVSIDGGARTVLAKNQSAGQSPAAVGGKLFWVAADASSTSWIFSLDVEKPRAPAKVAKTFGLTYCAIAHDEAAIYFADIATDTTRILRVAVSGGPPKPIAHYGSPASVRAIAVDSTNVYWASEGRILKAPKAGGETTELAASKNVWGIASDGKHVYWTDKGDVARWQGAGKVSRAPVDSGTVEIIADGLNLPWGIAVDSKHVYWAVNGEPGAITRAETSTGKRELVAAQQANPVHVVVDEQNIYWTTATDRTVWKLPK